MTDINSSSVQQSRCFALPSMIIILLMGAAYTWLDMLQLPESVTAILAFSCQA